jgi:hypothetical protein
MPTNQESKPNGSSAKFGNGGVRASQTGAGNGGANDTSGLLGGIQQRVTSRVDQQKQRAADGLGGIADVFRSASNELRSDNETLASYVDLAGDQMRRLADHIRQRGIADMLDDVHAFARRRPALFIGGAFVVGLGIARFLKSSAGHGGVRRYGNFSSVDPMTAGTGSPSYSGDLGEVGGY